VITGVSATDGGRHVATAGAGDREGIGEAVGCQ